jgi:hypothetical protein
MVGSSPFRYPYVTNQVTGMMSAAASLGLSLLWDTDVGLSHVDKYTYSAEEHIKVNVHSTLLKPEFLHACML